MTAELLLDLKVHPHKIFSAALSRFPKSVRGLFVFVSLIFTEKEALGKRRGEGRISARVIS